MKTLLKTLLTTAGLALAANVAQANPYVLIATTDDVLTGGHGATPKSFIVTSDVYSDGTPGPSEYKYTYEATVPLPNLLGTPAVNEFSVFDIGNVASSISNPTGFTGAYDGATTVNWVTASQSTLLSLKNVTFDLESALPPTLGSAGAQDGSSWGDGASGGVYVPGGAVPDGGLTVTLLGGAFVALGALRRKIGC
jgi:hypothetical protein